MRQLMVRLSAHQHRPTHGLHRKIQVVAEAHQLDPRPESTEQLAHASIEELRPTPVSLGGHGLNRLARQLDRVLEAAGAGERALDALELLHALRMLGVVTPPHAIHQQSQLGAALLQRIQGFA